MSDHNAAFEALLQHLKEARGFDFTGYKRTTLMRRVQRRMQTLGIREFDEYNDYLQVHQDEFTQLLDTILINVTSFFRDPDSWAYLAAEIVPEILARRPEGPIRIWSAGCASGEEAYTLAMVFAEALGVEAFRDRVKIYATDIDEEALRYARLACYTPPERSPASAPSGSSRSSRTTGGVTASPGTCVVLSSSAATTSSRTPRSRTSTCWCAGTR